MHPLAINSLEGNVPGVGHFFGKKKRELGKRFIVSRQKRIKKGLWLVKEGAKRFFFGRKKECRELAKGFERGKSEGGFGRFFFILPPESHLVFLCVLHFVQGCP